MPEIEATLLPEDDLTIMFAQRECNWLQALEGDIDTSHFGFLHVGSVQPEHVSDDNMLKYQVGQPRAGVPRRPIPTGARCTAPTVRPTNGQTYWRFAHFGFPFWT